MHLLTHAGAVPGLAIRASVLAAGRARRDPNGRLLASTYRTPLGGSSDVRRRA